MPITSFAELRQQAQQTPAVSIAIAGAADPQVLISAAQARDDGLIRTAVLVGDSHKIDLLLQQLELDPRGFTIEHELDAQATADRAVAAINRGDAQILVKGSLDSASYFRAILNRDNGLRSAEVLSNISLFELPSYPKLLAVSDNAIVLLPDLAQKLAIIENSRALFSALGITPAKVAAVAAVEKVNPKMVATTDAAELSRLSQQGRIEGFIVDGPLGYDACISREAAIHKGLGDSPVAGDPDLLLMPNLESANMLGKAYKYHADADSGGLVMGARVPVILNSRSDSAERRYNSLLLAKLVAAAKQQ